MPRRGRGWQPVRAVEWIEAKQMGLRVGSCLPCHPISVGCVLIIHEPWDSLACLASDSVGQPLIIRLIIQTILLYPSGAV